MLVVVTTIVGLLMMPDSRAAAATGELKFVVGFAAGSGLDAIARVVAERVRTSTGKTVIVDNRPGGGGRVAGEAVARAEPDGSTILIAPIVTTAFTPFVVKNLSFDPLRDLAPITRLGNFKFTLAVNADVPANNVRDFVSYVKANPGKISYANPGRARPLTSWARCSTAPPAPTSSTCPTAVQAQRRSHCSGAGPIGHQHDGGNAPLVQGQEGQAARGHWHHPRAGDAGRADIRRAEDEPGRHRGRGNVVQLPRAGQDDLGRVPALNALLVEALKDFGGSRPAPQSRYRGGDEHAEEFAKLIKADYERWGRVIRSTGFTVNE